jgi:hypothetical protein
LARKNSRGSIAGRIILAFLIIIAIISLLDYAAGTAILKTIFDRFIEFVRMVYQILAGGASG